jgi:hypothetical protein
VIHVRRPGKEGSIRTDLRDKIRTRLEQNTVLDEASALALGKRTEDEGEQDFIALNVKMIRDGLYKCLLK